ncbi:Excinuclease ABC subunit C [hydrothermal vent metagenome]|uniref:Excinuclease ABC subunit C n=1 Tax=hydrothermal vent metagenome TaxID=652676 RepID=A0A3B0T5J8_9ZZZZ
MMELQDSIKNLPVTSGVYLMKSSTGKVIYVGKAINIKKRVQSYFRKTKGAVSKTDLLVSEIKSIDCLETASEAGALILEASLIKQYAPKYNIELRDDKSYPYIEVTADEYPKISIQRPHRKKKNAHYYGPYVNPGLIREALILLRKIFPFRTCDPFPKKECLDCHIGLCDAPCIKKITKRNYQRNIKNVCLILEGKKDLLYRRLRSEMENAAKTQCYEQAAKARDQLRAIGALYSGTKDINYYKEAEQLKRALNLKRTPQRIETFDISNTFGNQAVGSMVSFLAGKPDKKNYRKFKIKEVQGIDDFRMMAEVVKRRYRRLRNEGKTFPDLIVIDGGKGQLSAAYHELKVLNIEIPIISLAKREEEIFLPGKKNSIVLSKSSLGLNLLMRSRDEAHRFAVTYHRTLRKKKAFA